MKGQANKRPDPIECCSTPTPSIEELNWKRRRVSQSNKDIKNKQGKRNVIILIADKAGKGRIRPRIMITQRRRVKFVCNDNIFPNVRIWKIRVKFLFFFSFYFCVWTHKGVGPNVL